jgi:holo-[acyl-carrier protein] synthase
MIRGLGLDVVSIDRIEAWRRREGILERFFHPQELEDARSRGPLEAASLAARFAAKEAFGKALGTGLAGFSLREVSVVNDEHGQPHLRLAGRALERLVASGGSRVLVTLTHEHDYAIAVVVIEE